MKNKEKIEKYTPLIIILIIFVILLGMFLIFRNFLNCNSGAVQSIATIALILVTSYYTYHTAKMSQQAEKQITSDIKIDVIEKICEQFPSCPAPKKDEMMKFKIIINIFNKNSASGGITFPKLKITNKIIGDIIILSPYDTDEYFFIRGGEIIRRTLEFFYFIGQNNDLKEMQHKLMESQGNFDYYLVYKNNLNEEFETKIDIEIKK